MSEAMWGGRFKKAEEKSTLDFNASISFDCRMYWEDIASSLAHAAMLEHHGIISQKDLEAITAGLKDIRKQIDEGNFEFSVELEDIHMNVEKRLTDAIGDAGARLHTARSRNDQTAVERTCTCAARSPRSQKSSSKWKKRSSSFPRNTTM